MNTRTELLAEIDRIDVALIDAHLAQAEARPRHDCRDRRHSNMDTAVQAIANCVADLTEFADQPLLIPGVAYSVADRLARLAVELEAFKARDLINLRKIQS